MAWLNGHQRNFALVGGLSAGVWAQRRSPPPRRRSSPG
ncbi:hypothetical protein [Mycobacterium sp. NAZ190054]